MAKGESFNFGANVKPKKPKAAGGKKPRKRGRSSKKSRAYFRSQFGS